jgi:hypothetical protein
MWMLLKALSCSVFVGCFKDAHWRGGGGVPYVISKNAQERIKHEPDFIETPSTALKRLYQQLYISGLLILLD